MNKMAILVRFRIEMKLGYLRTNQQYPFVISMTQRKTSKKSQNLSSTPTQQPSLSPSRKQTLKSPLSSSKYITQSNYKPNVSYGELQIVLENIQQIRKKAAAQVKALTIENQHLKDEQAISGQVVDQLRSRIEKFENSFGEAEERLKWQLDVVEKQKVSIEKQLQQKEQRIIELEVKNKEYEKLWENEQDNVQTRKNEIDELKKKWKWAFTVLAGNEQRSQELIWKIKNDGVNIWDLLDSQTDQSQQLRHKNQQIGMLQSQIQLLKEQNRQSTSLLDKCLGELNGLNTKISQYQEDIKEYNERLRATQKNHGDESYELRVKLKEAKQFGQKWNRLHEEAQIAYKKKCDTMEQRIQQLENDLKKREDEEKYLKQKRDYENLIAEVCDQTEEYSQLLDRVRYLQKFRSEHYFNIEKIQFLCKMLDY